MSTINLSDYQFGLDNQVNFGGHSSPEDLENLNKALAAGSITGRETTNLTTASGSPLKVESLEKTLKVLTFSEKQIVFWQNIPKMPAFNTVEEYNQLTSYGQDRGGFNNEGELPVEEDSTFVRRAQYVKYLGTTRSVTHPMTLVNTMVGNAIDLEAKNGTMWILRKLERALFTGNADVVPQEFNGIISQHAQNDAFTTLNDYYDSEVVVDLRGGALTESSIEDAANGIVQNFGIGTDLYAPPKVLSDFVKGFYGNKFIQPNTQALTDGVMGQRVKSFESQFGNINLNHDIFLNAPAPKKSTTGATHTSAPLAPTAVSVTPVSSDVSGKFASTDAGNYYYAVVALNKFGESAVTVLNSGAISAIVAGGAADLAFTDNASANPTTGFRIFRSQKGAPTVAAANFYPIFDISVAQKAAGYDGAAAAAVRDRNRYMTNVNQAFLIQQDEQILAFKQLAPLMKMDLSITGPAFRFMMLLYGTPFLYAPKKMVRFINIGNA